MQHINNHIPGWPIAASAATSWAWLPQLASVNEVLTGLLTLAGIVLTGLKIYDWIKKRNERNP